MNEIAQPSIGDRAGTEDHLWYINPGGGAPRFVTAHPLPKL
jgi:hypothetical protein